MITLGTSTLDFFGVPAIQMISTCSGHDVESALVRLTCAMKIKAYSPFLLSNIINFNQGDVGKKYKKKVTTRGTFLHHESVLFIRDTIDYVRWMMGNTGIEIINAGGETAATMDLIYDSMVNLTMIGKSR